MISKQGKNTSFIKTKPTDECYMSLESKNSKRTKLSAKQDKKSPKLQINESAIGEISTIKQNIPKNSTKTKTKSKPPIVTEAKPSNPNKIYFEIPQGKISLELATSIFETFGEIEKISFLQLLPTDPQNLQAGCVAFKKQKSAYQLLEYNKSSMITVNDQEVKVKKFHKTDQRLQKFQHGGKSNKRSSGSSDTFTQNNNHLKYQKKGSKTKKNTEPEYYWEPKRNNSRTDRESDLHNPASSSVIVQNASSRNEEEARGSHTSPWPNSGNGSNVVLAERPKSSLRDDMKFRAGSSFNLGGFQNILAPKMLRKVKRNHKEFNIQRYRISEGWKPGKNL